MLIIYIKIVSLFNLCFPLLEKLKYLNMPISPFFKFFHKVSSSPLPILGGNFTCYTCLPYFNLLSQNQQMALYTVLMPKLTFWITKFQSVIHRFALLRFSASLHWNTWMTQSSKWKAIYKYKERVLLLLCKDIRDK